MQCRDFEALRVSRDDGALTRADERRLREHMDMCESCARLERDLSRLEYELEGLAEVVPDPPPFFKARVLARLEEAKLPRRRSLRALFSSRRVLALSTACLAFFAGVLARELHRVNDWVRRGGSREVVLEYDAPDARLVTLAGDFNEWGRESKEIGVERKGDRWLFHVRVKPGRYQYAFVVDGKKWLPDPRAPGIIPDGFGGMNSVLYVQQGGPEKSQPL